MSTKKLITINRQFGSYGRKIGSMLASQLGIRYYDRDLITLAAQESGFTEQLFENADEKPTNSLLYSIVMGSYINRGWFYQGDNVFSAEKLFSIQADVINKVSKESCVIVGRCADYLLRNDPALVTVFTHAPLPFRMDAVRKERTELSDKELELLINRTDKNRANYYNFYTGKNWKDPQNYNLSIDVEASGIEGSVELITKLLEVRGKL